MSFHCSKSQNFSKKVTIKHMVILVELNMAPFLDATLTILESQ